MFAAALSLLAPAFPLFALVDQRLAPALSLLAFVDPLLVLVDTPQAGASSLLALLDDRRALAFPVLEKPRTSSKKSNVISST